jgi:hypothetical protein
MLASFLLISTSLAFAQDVSAKSEISHMYYLGIGLVIFLALFAVYSIYEKINYWCEDKAERKEEEARRARLQNDERRKHENRI